MDNAPESRTPGESPAAGDSARTAVRPGPAPAPRTTGTPRKGVAKNGSASKRVSEASGQPASAGTRPSTKTTSSAAPSGAKPASAGSDAGKSGAAKSAASKPGGAKSGTTSKPKRSTGKPARRTAAARTSAPRKTIAAPPEQVVADAPEDAGAPAASAVEPEVLVVEVVEAELVESAESEAVSAEVADAEVVEPDVAEPDVTETEAAADDAVVETEAAAEDAVVETEATTVDAEVDAQDAGTAEQLDAQDAGTAAQSGADVDADNAPASDVAEATPASPGPGLAAIQAGIAAGAAATGAWFARAGDATRSQLARWRRAVDADFAEVRQQWADARAARAEQAAAHLADAERVVAERRAERAEAARAAAERAEAGRAEAERAEAERAEAERAETERAETERTEAEHAESSRASSTTLPALEEGTPRAELEVAATEEPEPVELIVTRVTAHGPAPSGTALSVRGAAKRFGDTVAVDGIDLDVPAGCFYGIVGPNGAGKTTLLSMISGLVRPDEGTILVHDADVWKDPIATKRDMGVLPDRLRLFDRLTGSQLLYYSAMLRGMDRATARRRTADLASVFGIEDAMGRLITDYSTGMTKKVALAAAMIHAPRLLVLDEPFESVDPVSAATVTEILRKYALAGGTVVLSSHSMDLVQRMCDRVAVIVGGGIIAEGTVAEVRGAATLQERFVELAARKQVEELEWLHGSSS